MGTEAAPEGVKTQLEGLAGATMAVSLNDPVVKWCRTTPPRQRLW